jgi:hypothetical protein
LTFSKNSAIIITEREKRRAKMERIKFTYEFDDEEFGHNKNVKLELANDAVHLRDICEMFEEFITSTGFSLDGVLRYFKS